VRLDDIEDAPPAFLDVHHVLGIPEERDATAAAVDQVLGSDPAPGVVVDRNRRDSVVGHRLLDRHTGDAAPSHLTKLY